MHLWAEMNVVTSHKSAKMCGQVIICLYDMNGNSPVTFLLRCFLAAAALAPLLGPGSLTGFWLVAAADDMFYE